MSSSASKVKSSPGQPSRSGPDSPVEMIRTESGVAYWADSVDLLREFVPDESVDLIVTSPPFSR